MSETFPFAYRVILLLGLMVVAAIVDYRRRGAQAERYREYGFICIAGMLGGLFGFANDCVTSGVSPEYFTLGKGLEAGGGLRWRAGVFGFKAGLSAGAVAAAICMFARGKKSRFTTGQLSKWLGSLWMPLAGAILLGLALPFIVGTWDPLEFASGLASLLSANQIARFRRVWWVHMGLYTGLILGLAGMLIRRRIDSDSN